MARSSLVGILALQGDFAAHADIIRRLGANVCEIRGPEDLSEIDAVILPGGESTVMTLGVEREGLAQPLRDLVHSGVPVLATCAGMILLDREHLGLLDIQTLRNAFGRQVKSFETDLRIAGFHTAVHAIFIRAPWITARGEGVEVLAEIDGHPVAIRQDNIVALAFHPELSGETRFHETLLESAAAVEARKAQEALPR